MPIWRVQPVCSLYNPFNKTHKFAIKRLENHKGKKVSFSCQWNRTANTRTPTVNPRRRRFDTEKSSGASNEEGDDSNKHCRENITQRILNAKVLLLRANRRFWMISLKRWAKIGLVGLPFVKCHEMWWNALFGLRWVFTVQIAVIVVWKISFNSCLIGLDQLYTDRASRSSREKDLKNIFSTSSPACLTWPRGNDIRDRLVDGSDFGFGQNLFLFASFLISFFFLLV